MSTYLYFLSFWLGACCGYILCLFFWARSVRQAKADAEEFRASAAAMQESFAEARRVLLRSALTIMSERASDSSNQAQSSASEREGKR